MNAQAKLGPRFSDALVYAAEAHRGQVRKGTETPYVSHVMAVAGLALEYGADEDTAVAALLHDVVEDQGGVERLADVSRRFGHRVAGIVRQCSDTIENPKPAWQVRKGAHVAHLRHASDEARLVTAADKIHNARSILADHRAVGDAVWSRFSVPRERTVGYYRAVADALCARGGNRIFSELNLEVARLEALGTPGASFNDGPGTGVGDRFAPVETWPSRAGVKPVAAPEEDSGEERERADSIPPSTSEEDVNFAKAAFEAMAPGKDLTNALELGDRVGATMTREEWDAFVEFGRLLKSASGA